MSDEQDEPLQEIVQASLLEDPSRAPVWIAVMLASISDTLDDIATALENRTAPRRRKR